MYDETAYQGLRELEANIPSSLAIRRMGGGYKCIEDLDSSIIQGSEQLVAPDTRRDLMSASRPLLINGACWRMQ